MTVEAKAVDVAIIGAGTAGLAALRAARKGDASVVLIGEPPFGTTCARVGCMPSKVLLAHAHHAKAVRNLSKIQGKDEPLIFDTRAILKDVRSVRDHFVSAVKDGLEEFDPHEFIQGHARFKDENTLEVFDNERLILILPFKTVIIATGSKPRVLQGFQGQDKVITTDDLFELSTLPERTIIVGDGAIALECATALANLGSAVTVLGHGGPVGGLTDKKVAHAAEHALFDNIIFIPDQENLTLKSTNKDEVEISFVAENIKKSLSSDIVLFAIGRDPNFENLNLESLNLETEKSGSLKVDPLTGQTSLDHIFVAGDATGSDTILHAASQEGQHAGENGLRENACAGFVQPRLRLVFTDPGVAIVGASRADLNKGKKAYVTGEVDFSEQGRAMAEGRNKGRLHVYACATTGSILGAEMVAPDAEHIAHLIVAALKANWTISRFLDMPFYHPTTLEGLRTALRDANHKAKRAEAPMPNSLDLAAGC